MFFAAFDSTGFLFSLCSHSLVLSKETISGLGRGFSRSSVDQFGEGSPIFEFIS